MKAPCFALAVVFLLGASPYAAAGGVTIEDTTLPGGGQALTIHANQPDASYTSRFGPVYADQTQLVAFESQKPITRHSGAVALHWQKTGLVLLADNLTDPGHGPMSINGLLTIQSAATDKAGGTTVECRDGNIYVNGKATRQFTSAFHTDIAVSCSGNTILIRPKKA